MDDAELKLYLDTDKALERIRGNKKLFKTLLTHFLATRAQYEQLKQEMGANDHDSAAKTVHAIKGVAANLSMAKLYDQSVEVEAILKKSASDTAEVMASFGDAFEKTMKQVEDLLQSSFFD